MMRNYIYIGKYVGNVLIVGPTECGKTSFIQNLGINNFLEVLKKKLNGFLELNWML